MAKRREVMCSDCQKIFKTHSKKRFKCNICEPPNSIRKDKKFKQKYTEWKPGFQNQLDYIRIG